MASAFLCSTVAALDMEGNCCSLLNLNLIRIINIFAFFPSRFKKAVQPVSSYKRLIIPCIRTWLGSFRCSRTKIPEGEFSRPKPLPIHSPPRETALLLSCALIIHSMKQRLKRMRLVDHLRNSPDSFKIGAIRPYSVNANISDKKHAHFTFAHSFGSK